MKRHLPSFVIFFFCATMSFAQAPKGINYQGVARDTEGNPIANKAISMRISILKNSATGDVEYAETHKPTTNQFGLFTLVVGQGTVSTGNFSFISWAIGTKWLQIEIDANGGSNYTLAGSQQLMTVPYAFYAEYTNNAGITAGQGITVSNGVVSNTGDADNDPTNELQTLADVLTKSSNAGTIKINNLGEPLAANDAATKNYVDAQNALQTLSEILTKGNDAGAKQIKNLGAPTDETDAATKSYVDTKSASLDQSATNEIQDLTLNTTTNILKITNNAAATNIDLSPYKQTLSQVLTTGNNAGGQKITNLGTPTVNSDATTKVYVDNAIATNYAFKVPYSFTNSGTAAVNQVVSLGADIYDDFNVVASNRYVAPVAGTYMFYVDGTLNNAGISLEIRVNSTTIYPIRKQDVIIGASVFVNNTLSLMVKLSKDDFVEVYITSFVPGDNVSGTLFGYKL